MEVDSPTPPPTPPPHTQQTTAAKDMTEEAAVVPTPYVLHTLPGKGFIGSRELPLPLLMQTTAFSAYILMGIDRANGTNVVYGPFLHNGQPHENAKIQEVADLKHMSFFTADGSVVPYDLVHPQSNLSYFKYPPDVNSGKAKYPTLKNLALDMVSVCNLIRECKGGSPQGYQDGGVASQKDLMQPKPNHNDRCILQNEGLAFIQFFTRPTITFTDKQLHRIIPKTFSTMQAKPRSKESEEEDNVRKRHALVFNLFQKNPEAVKDKAEMKGITRLLAGELPSTVGRVEVVRQLMSTVYFCQDVKFPDGMTCGVAFTRDWFVQRLHCIFKDQVLTSGENPGVEKIMYSIDGKLWLKKFEDEKKKQQQSGSASSVEAASAAEGAAAGPADRPKKKATRRRSQPVAKKEP